MTDLAVSLAEPAPRWRLLIPAALGLAVGALAWRLSPTPAPAVVLGAVVGVAATTLIVLLEAAEAAALARIFASLALVATLALAAPDPTRLELAFAFGSLGLLGFGVWRSLAGTRGLDVTWSLALALIAALAAFNAYYVIASQDLEIADFMYYRVVSIAVGTLLRDGNVAGVAMNLAHSMSGDYSWAPALLPGAALAGFGLLSRAVYQAALMAFYAAPALLALAWAAGKLARARPTAFALAAVAAAYPFGIVVAARGMPDIGGVALVVIALNLADRLALALSLPAPRVLVRKLAFVLALTLFGMFLFRRWYAFAAVAIVIALAGEVAVIALRQGRAFRWREAALAASVGALTLIALLAPVLADWLPHPAAHDYAAMYAAYRKTPEVLMQVVGDWCGFGVLALALAGGFVTLARNGSRFARLAFVTSPLAALLFLRVQSPYPHHLYLLAPFVTLFIAAPLTMLYTRSHAAGLAALAALAALTMTPAGALLPAALFPTAGHPHPPRSDMAELARLKDWVDARATPTHKVCGLGSSYTFSGQLIGELWQLKAEKSPLTRVGEKSSGVGMTDVDTVDGAPNPAMKDCAVMIVGDPVQTHVIPSYQLTVTLPSTEVLTGTGIGAHYRRTGEVFALEHGVHAVVFEQISPLSDADMAALDKRWSDARAR